MIKDNGLSEGGDWGQGVVSRVDYQALAYRASVGRVRE